MLTHFLLSWAESYVVPALSKLFYLGQFLSICWAFLFSFVGPFLDGGLYFLDRLLGLFSGQFSWAFFGPVLGHFSGPLISIWVVYCWALFVFLIGLVLIPLLGPVFELLLGCSV